jgi:hypothetical protein
MEVGMLDDLRNSATSSFDEKLPEKAGQSAYNKNPEQLFLGMTAAQRFVITLLLFLAVVVIGALFLVVTDKVTINLQALPGF